MDNRDFRDRLKSHTTEANPVAWDQMQSLLDSLPEVKPEKKKKRGFWLFFVGLGLVAILGTTWVVFNSANNLDKRYGVNQIIEEPSSQESKLAANEIKKDTRTEDNTLISNSVNHENSNLSVSDKIVNEGQPDNFGQTENQRKLKLNNNTLYSQSKPEVKATTKRIVDSDLNPGQQLGKSERTSVEHKTDSLSDSSVSLNEKSNSGLFDLTKMENFDREENTSLVIDRVENDAIKRGLENNSKSVDDDNGGIESKTLIKSNEKVDNANEPNNIGEAKNSRTTFLQIRKLVLPFDEIVPERKENITPVVGVEIVSPSRLSVFLGGGYAMFNNNPGYFISGGAMFDLDQIIELETNLGYAYGSEQNIPSGEPFTFEKQLDLSFLIHLNIVKYRSHMLSLFTGIGYSFYSGERVNNAVIINIEERKSKGINLQGGINYKIRIRKNYALGLRVGVISYDDAVTYISPRFLYNF